MELIEEKRNRPSRYPAFRTTNTSTTTVSSCLGDCESLLPDPKQVFSRAALATYYFSPPMTVRLDQPRSDSASKLPSATFIDACIRAGNAYAAVSFHLQLFLKVEFPAVHR